MTILIIGGTGKTGLRLAHLLQGAGKSVLLTSRSGEVPQPFKGTKFDWFDPSTYKNPFGVDTDIGRVYFVGPPLMDGSLPYVKEFVELALSRGVKRFVPLGATIFDKGGRSMGKVHEYLASIGVEYCMLRPTWFMDNFSSIFQGKIRDENTIISTAKDGRIPFVAADDIAEVAFRALLTEGNLQGDRLIVGPDLYSYDEVAALLSEVLGRKITHKKILDEEAKEFWISLGMTEVYALAMIWMEGLAAAGDEEKHFYAPERDAGKKPLRQFFEENRELWIPK